jgi:DAK2 domain fusion protein YloV
MLAAACQYLESRKAAVDALNVFPVPDGDTGTNMSLTLLSAVRMLGQKAPGSLDQVTQWAAQGALLGARGNSGVILSQFFSGVQAICEGIRHMDGALLCKAMESGAELAYKAVMNPVKGTILTVFQESARGMRAGFEAGETDIETLLEAARESAQMALELTPNMLPILKQAGVVDAGGQGFVYILEGFLTELRGEGAAIPMTEKPAPQIRRNIQGYIPYGYCTEFIIQKKDQVLNLEKIKAFLADKGDSQLVVGTPQTCKVHIHTNAPGEVLSFALIHCGGTLHDIKIDNLTEQAMNANLSADMDPKQTVLIAVAAGAGMEEIFRSLGADHIITGGQTMNPSTQDFVDVMDALEAKEYIILPNNANVIMAAEQAGKLWGEGAHVVRTVTMPQGIGALMAFNQELGAADNICKMEEAFKGIVTLEVTRAVRDAEFDAHHIRKGQFLGFIERKLEYIGDSAEDTARELLTRTMGRGNELVTVYYGQDAAESKAQALVQVLLSQFPDIDVEMHQGGQPVYYYLISVE